MQPPTGHIVLQTRCRGKVTWRTFQQPLHILDAFTREEIPAVISRLETHIAQGHYAAGYITYEAAGGFDPALVTHPAPADQPLLRFGIYRNFSEGITPPAYAEASYDCSRWEADETRESFRKQVQRIKDYIASGDTYQVNYSFRLHAAFSGNPWLFFYAMVQAQKSAQAAYMDLGNQVLCSASPELFFACDGPVLRARPMKGTAPRGLLRQEDDARRDALYHSEKNRAENIMIVDMIRNDMGRIAVPGSVKVQNVYHIEKYPTVYQMTSEVSSSSRAAPGEMLSALFPCASVTGAPKKRTMEIIRELEHSPRGPYTGSMGFFGPNREAEFNVAIRTACLDRPTRQITYGVGAGIVWDSEADDEYAECLAKARVLTRRPPDFFLFETLLWEPATGYFLHEDHVRRLEDSAAYFDFPFDRAGAMQALQGAITPAPARPRRVRLTCRDDGALHTECTDMQQAPRPGPYLLGLDREPVDSEDVFLYHKTSHRLPYEAARSRVPGATDVLLWNQREELTESCMANLVIRMDGKQYTPPVRCGLLGGVFRKALIDRGEMEERILFKRDIARAEKIFLINSVRKWIPVIMKEQV